VTVSLRGRLLILVVLLMLGGLLVADAVTYVQLRSFLLGQVDQRLAEAFEQIEHGPNRPGGGYPGPGGNRGGARPDFETTRSSAPGLYAGTVSSTGTVVWRISGGNERNAESAPDLPATLPSVPPGGKGEGPEGRGGAAAPILTVPSTVAGTSAYRVRLQATDDGTVVVTALPLTEVDSTLQRLLGIEVIVTIVVVALSAAIGSWLVRVGLRPLDDISDTAAEIAAGDLSRRVSRADDRTEVGRLGTSLNTMLGQIETAFDERQESEQALRASEARLRRFVADASHELRTPLAAVQAYAELFERGAKAHPEDLPRLMNNIHKESARMAVLVDDLLLLTRLDQGRPLDQSPVDLAAIAADAVEAARAVDPERPLVLETLDSVEVAGDRVRLRQIIDNLLANTRIHTPPGTPVEVEVGTEDGAAVLKVVDHGPGLEPDQAAAVFERFYRADPSRARSDGGTGLGLSIVAAIAAAHNGTVAVRPTPGGGATFAVWLPLLHEDVDERPTPVPI
jgi:two-component system OmpR family sensor kinase